MYLYRIWICISAHLDDVVQAALEAVHAGGDDEGGAAQAGRPSPRRHPVVVHALHEAQRRVRDVVGLGAEVELLREPRDEEARVDLRQVDAQQVGELHGQFAQARDVAGVVVHDVAEVCFRGGMFDLHEKRADACKRCSSTIFERGNNFMRAWKYFF